MIYVSGESVAKVGGCWEDYGHSCYYHLRGLIVDK